MGRNMLFPFGQKRFELSLNFKSFTFLQIHFTREKTVFIALLKAIPYLKTPHGRPHPKKDE